MRNRSSLIPDLLQAEYRGSRNADKKYTRECRKARKIYIHLEKIPCLLPSSLAQTRHGLRRDIFGQGQSPSKASALQQVCSVQNSGREIRRGGNCESGYCQSIQWASPVASERSCDFGDRDLVKFDMISSVGQIVSWLREATRWVLDTERHSRK